MRPECAWSTARLKSASVQSGRVAGRRDQERVIAARLVSKAAALLVRKLGCAAPAGELEAERFQDRQCARIDAVAREGKHRRPWQAELGTAVVDRLDLFLQSTQILVRDGHVIAGVVADLEAVPVQMGDLFPGHVVQLVGLKIEALGNEEGRAEVVLEQNGPHDREVGFHRIVESEHNQAIGNRLAG